MTVSGGSECSSEMLKQLNWPKLKVEEGREFFANKPDSASKDPSFPNKIDEAVVEKIRKAEK